MLLVCILGIEPWTARNFVRLHKVLPVRSNFWPEAYFGNVSFSLHPTADSILHRTEVEMVFAGGLRARVMDPVRSPPRDFARLTPGRIYAFGTEPLRFG